MSKRLQVLLDAAEFREIQKIARRKRMSVSEWVRQALRRARQSEPVKGADRKLEAVRAATRHSFPTAEIEDMLTEIERGYLGDPD